jgi:DNA polymerase III delta subunit
VFASVANLRTCKLLKLMVLNIDSISVQNVVQYIRRGGVMNIAELKKDMKANNLAGLYIFTGEEIYIRNLYIEQIVDLGFIWKELPNVAELFKSVGTTKLIQKPTLYVIRDDMDFIKQDSTVWDKLVAWVNNSVNKVILIYNNIDKRNKFFKTFEENTVKFEKLSETVLLKYVQKEADISRENALDLIHRCDSNFNLCLLELNKVIMFSLSNNISIDEAYRKCCADRIVLDLPKESLEKYITAVMNKDFSLAIEISNDFDFTEEPPLKILAFLYNSFEALFAVVAYESGLSLKKNESGANFWAVKNAEIFGMKWQIKQVRDMMDFIQFLESGIKMGMVSADAAIPMLSATFIALQNNFKFCTRYKDEIKERNRKLVKQNLKIAK